VLRGASRFTAPRLRSPRYRNFFLPDRQDLPAGFRTVSRGPGA
jgi:iron(II)-dependent oxidoreductase